MVEDTVQYKLFLARPGGSDVAEEHLTRLAEEILARFAPLLVQYIWQNQPFNLKYRSEKGMNMPLQKPMRYSRCIYLLELKPNVCVGRRGSCSHWRKHPVWRKRRGRVVYCLPPPANHRGFPGAGSQVGQNVPPVSLSLACARPLLLWLHGA